MSSVLMYMIAKNNKIICKVGMVLLCFAVLFLLSSCENTGELNTNLSMQTELEARDPNPPLYFPPDPPEECPGSHSLMWAHTEKGHYQICHLCGKQLSSEESHETTTTLTDGYIIIDDVIYIIETCRCKCGTVTETIYNPFKGSAREASE